MAGVPVIAPEVLSARERAAVADLYVDAFRRKLRVSLGPDPSAFVATHVNVDRLLLVKDADDVLGMAGLRFDGRGFFEPDAAAFSARYGLTSRVRLAAWRSTQTLPRPQQVLVEALAVRSDVRGTGIGSTLLEAVERRARSTNRSAVILEVVDTNPRARSLYRRSGYRTVHTVRRAAFRLAGFRSADLMLKDV